MTLRQGVICLRMSRVTRRKSALRGKPSSTDLWTHAQPAQKDSRSISVKSYHISLKALEDTRHGRSLLGCCREVCTIYLSRFMTLWLMFSHTSRTSAYPRRHFELRPTSLMFTPTNGMVDPRTHTHTHTHTLLGIFRFLPFSKLFVRHKTYKK